MLKTENDVEVFEAYCHFELLLVDNRLVVDVAQVELVEEGGHRDDRQSGELQTNSGCWKEAIPFLKTLQKFIKYMYVISKWF